MTVTDGAEAMLCSAPVFLWLRSPMTAVTPIPAADPTARNIVFLSLALALGMSSGSLVVASAGIVGHGMIADDHWAT